MRPVTRSVLAIGAVLLAAVLSGLGYWLSQSRARAAEAQTQAVRERLEELSAALADLEGLAKQPRIILASPAQRVRHELAPDGSRWKVEISTDRGHDEGVASWIARHREAVEEYGDGR